MLNLNTINNESSTATEDLKLDYDGEVIEIGFNSNIMDIVNNLEDENTMYLKDNISPIIAQENLTRSCLCSNANESIEFGKNKKYRI